MPRVYLVSYQKTNVPRVYLVSYQKTNRFPSVFVTIVTKFVTMSQNRPSAHTDASESPTGPAEPLKLRWRKGWRTRKDPPCLSHYDQSLVPPQFPGERTPNRGRVTWRVENNNKVCNRTERPQALAWGRLGLLRPTCVDRRNLLRPP